MVFSANGEGTLTLVHEIDPEHFAVSANLPTQSKARTLALDANYIGRCHPKHCRAINKKTGTDASARTNGLPRLVGLKQAMEIALLGDRFDAETALRFGLINRIVPVDELSSATADLAKRLAQGPTLALGRTKRLLNESLNQNLTDQLRAEQESFVACAMSRDFAEGVSAFIEKRKPVFKGN